MKKLMKTNQDQFKVTFKTKLRLRYFSLKSKLKKMKFNKEKFLINFFIGLAFISILVGLIIFSIFLFKLSKYYTISSDHIELDKTGQVGDFVGGIVGAIWSLTGVLLFYATLRLQGKELKENRVHFQLNRLTDIIYRQLDMFNKQLDSFELKDIESDSNGQYIKYIGRSAINILKLRLEAIREIANEIENGETDAVYKYIGKNFKFLEINEKEFLKIYEELGNHTDTIRAILIKEDIPPADLNELKGIFFRNIGREFLNSSELLLPIIDIFIDYKKQTEDEFDEFWSGISSVKTKIRSIREFRQKIYDKKTIEQYIAGRDTYNMHSF